MLLRILEVSSFIREWQQALSGLTFAQKKVKQKKREVVRVPSILNIARWPRQAKTGSKCRMSAHRDETRQAECANFRIFSTVLHLTRTEYSPC